MVSRSRRTGCASTPPPSGSWPSTWAGGPRTAEGHLWPIGGAEPQTVAPPVGRCWAYGTTNGSQVGSHGSQVGSRGSQVGSHGSQVGSRGSQVGSHGSQVESAVSAAPLALSC